MGKMFLLNAIGSIVLFVVLAARGIDDALTAIVLAILAPLSTTAWILAWAWRHRYLTLVAAYNHEVNKDI